MLVKFSQIHLFNHNKSYLSYTLDWIVNTCWPQYEKYEKLFQWFVRIWIFNDGKWWSCANRSLSLGNENLIRQYRYICRMPILIQRWSTKLNLNAFPDELLIKYSGQNFIFLSNSKLSRTLRSYVLWWWHVRTQISPLQSSYIRWRHKISKRKYAQMHLSLSHLIQ